MIIQNKKIFASILFVLISSAGVAQGTVAGPPPPAPPPPPGLPIDAGVYLLLAIGIIYGVWKMLKVKQA